MPTGERCTVEILLPADARQPQVGECRIQRGTLSDMLYAVVIHGISGRRQNDDGDWIVTARCTRYVITEDDDVGAALFKAP